MKAAEDGGVPIIGLLFGNYTGTTAEKNADIINKTAGNANMPIDATIEKTIAKAGIATGKDDLPACAYNIRNSDETDIPADAFAVLTNTAKSLFSACSAYAASDVSVKATARINAQDGAYIRKGPGTNYGEISVLADNTKLTILKEVFTSDTRTGRKYRWYHANAGGIKGYVRSDCVDSIKYNGIAAVTTEELNYRSGPAVTMGIKGVAGKGESVTVRLEAERTGVSQKWYKVRYKGKTCYMCADYIKMKKSADGKNSSDKKSAKSRKRKPVKTVIKRRGVTRPDTLTTGEDFAVSGTITCNKKITKVITGITDSSGKWKYKHKAAVNAKSYDLQGADPFLSFETLRSGTYIYRVDVYVKGKRYTKIKKAFEVRPCKAAVKLMRKATDGGEARYVYTFNKNNCKPLFSVSGFNEGIIPQGLAYTGDKYYVLYGMDSAQAIVTYSSRGARLDAVEFPENTGHANGIAWVPKKERCYIFRGYSFSCISWRPSDNKFKLVDIPYSSSGVSYDSFTDMICVSSKTNIRIYSPDGRFTQIKEFGRCEHEGTSYVQDCGAARGYVFHGVSSDENYKHGTNYLDVYRVSDCKYMGSIKVKIDEIEGVIIDKYGFVELLCNDVSRTDYIWRTPLNVYDLQ